MAESTGMDIDDAISLAAVRITRPSPAPPLLLGTRGRGGREKSPRKLTMWTCPYCFVEMLATSRPGHLKNKQGCSEQHALFLAKEAEKKEEVKKRNLAFFAPRAPSRDSAERMLQKLSA